MIPSNPYLGIKTVMPILLIEDIIAFSNTVLSYDT